jgi:signal transduction histidine kinase
MFILITVAVVTAFLWVSSSLVRDLSQQERSRMQIWADATKEIASTTSTTDIDFLFSIIESNHTIPVLLVDDDDNILQHRNFSLPEPNDSLPPWVLSDANRRYLLHKLQELKKSANVIHIVISPGQTQHLYYEDSSLLQRLSWFPYVQLAVMIAFVAVVYFAVNTSRRAEQNKVWVGLSKETAHQLGTPISSLMAWVEMLPAYGVDSETISEMNKDVQRLSTIASRFGKIGSPPTMEAGDVNEVVSNACSYMHSRISSSVDFRQQLSEEPLPVMLSESLLQWVMENLIKNAVDAMEAHGSLTVATFRDGDMAAIEVTDTGRGIARKNFKTIFNPGFTTKKRGWGLGLTLARRIIEQYHRGRIYVKSSEPHVATTFKILLPLSI